jgi:uncharacterized membrane protein YphA (DoxX/SURF4 family)
MNTKNIKLHMEKYAAVILRYGVVIVFLWFSSQQFLHTEAWTAYIPESATDLTGQSAMTLVYLNATFELIFGLMLLLGWHTRIAALLLALHLLNIAYVVGYGEIAVRDFGLAVATLSVFMHGPDILCLDFKGRSTALSDPARLA